MAVNMKLKSLRGSLCLTQAQMAERIGTPCRNYSRIEQGVLRGTVTFWVKLQKAFGLSDAEIWAMQKGAADTDE